MCQSRILKSCCFPLQLKKEREQRAKKAAEEDRSEFDDLVSALRSGEVFDKDMSKMNRRKQRRHDFDISRERPVSKLEQWEDTCWAGAPCWERWALLKHMNISVTPWWHSFICRWRHVLVHGSRLYTKYTQILTVNPFHFILETISL